MKYRVHTCQCGYSVAKEVEMSDSTSNISGESTSWCPECGKRFMSASPVFEKSEEEQD